MREETRQHFSGNLACICAYRISMAEVAPPDRTLLPGEARQLLDRPPFRPGRPAPTLGIKTRAPATALEHGTELVSCAPSSFASHGAQLAGN